LSSKEPFSIIFDLDIRDLKVWLLGSGMMLLVVYDAQLNRAFFIELKDYFAENRESLVNARKFIRIYIPEKNILNPVALKELRATKNLTYGRN
jgi:Domain of unknown function (DUF4365)